MAKFMVAGDTSKPEPTVVFQLEIDNEGDLRLKANGKSVLFISRSTGLLNRFFRSSGDQIEGLQFDDQGFIRIE